MTSLELRLQEATAILEALRNQYTTLRADLQQAEQQYDAAKANAQSRDMQELDQWMQCEQSNRSALQKWRDQQSEAAQAALRRKKAWQHQLVVLFACLLSGGFFLILEIREIQTLQSKRDNPPEGSLQRTQTRMLEDARRKIAYLRSLSDPRPTQEMRDAGQEVFSLRKRRDMLSHQILIQEVRVNFLRQQISSSSSI